MDTEFIILDESHGPLSSEALALIDIRGQEDHLSTSLMDDNGTTTLDEWSDTLELKVRVVQTYDEVLDEKDQLIGYNRNINSVEIIDLSI